MSDSGHLKEVAPFPWKSYKIRYKTRSRPHLYRLVDGQDLTVLLVPGKEGTGTGDRAKEIAGYVLHAANDYEKLLVAAKHMREVQKQADWGNLATEEIWREAEEELEAAIKKAERKTT